MAREAHRGREGAVPLRADRRRPLEPDLPGDGRRRRALRSAPATAGCGARDRARHGTRAPDHRRDRREDGGAGSTRIGDVRRRLGERRPLLRDEVRRGPRDHRFRVRFAAVHGREAARDRRVPDFGARAPAPRRSGCDRPRRARPKGSVPPTPVEALANAVGEVEDTRTSRDGGGARGADRADARAEVHGNRARRLPARELHHGRERAHRGGARLGASARSATCSPISDT